MLDCWRPEGLAPGRGAHADHERMNGEFCSSPASTFGYSMKGFVKCPHCQSPNATRAGDMDVAANGHVAKGACHAFVGRPSCEQWVSAINDFAYPEWHGCAAPQGKGGGGTRLAQCPQLVCPSSRRHPPAVCARPAAAAPPPPVCTPPARPAALPTADGSAVEHRAAAWLSDGPAQVPVGSHTRRHTAPAQPGTPATTPACPISGSATSPRAALAEAQQLVDRGKQQMAEMDFGDAAASFKAAARALAGQPYSLAGRTLWEESLLDLAQCQLNMQQFDACVDTCTKFMAAAGGSPTAFCAQYNCGCALLALGDFAGAVQQLELAAATAPEPQRGTVQELLQEVQHALQATVASQEQHHAPVMPLSHHRAAHDEPAGVPAPPAACLRCCRGRLDGALMHGTTLHICVCWRCACELAEQRKPCPKCHSRIDQIARVG